MTPPWTLPTRRIPGLLRPVPVIGAGCWTIGGPAANNTVPIGWDDVDPTAALHGLHRAYELGVRLFDTADVYGMGRSERLLGQLLAHVPRGEVTISSKVGYHTGTAAHSYVPDQIRRQFHRTLNHLGTDYLDLYFLHSTDFGPSDRYLDGALRVIAELRQQGLIRAVGLRAPHDFAAEWAHRNLGRRSQQAARFLYLFDTIRPDILTVRHNLLSWQYTDAETDIFAFAQRRGAGVLIKQALAQGILLGTHDPEHLRTFSSQDHRSVDPTFRRPVLRAVHDGLATARQAVTGGPTLLMGAAIGYALKKTDAAVLVGFRNAAQIQAAVAATTSPVTPDEIDTVHHALGAARAVLHSDLVATCGTSTTDPLQTKEGHQ